MVEDPRTGADGNGDAGDDPDIFAFHSTPCAASSGRSIYFLCMEHGFRQVEAVSAAILPHGCISNVSAGGNLPQCLDYLPG
jgi:hypothetical protein